MVYKLIKTDNYLLVVDDSVHPYDSSKVGNPLAHLPINGSPILEGVDLLPPYSRHQEDGLEELAEVNYPIDDWTEEQCLVRRLAFKAGYKKAREKYKYTDEDMRKAISHAYKQARPDTEYEPFPLFHQYPTEFETEDVLTPSQIFYPNDVPYSSPKTIITAQGVQWVGKYK